MKIDQCLFGYDSGHRLLATSLPLGHELSRLTALSDLTPGSVLGERDGYWTGHPAPSIGRYALMKTWPAPEMSRPGCVWTHTLLIPIDVLGSLPNLESLMRLVERPSGRASFANYKLPLSLSERDVGFSGATGNKESHIHGDVLLALYGDKRGSIKVESTREVDASIFSVWSQQWPKLRRNFRFQTAPKRVSLEHRQHGFDVVIYAGSNERWSNHRTLVELSKPWLRAALADLNEGENGKLRTFLKRYGEDVRKQRGSFRPLADIYAASINGFLRHADVVSLIDIVRSAFPEPDDALRLKDDLMSGLFAEEAQVEVLCYALQKSETSFPVPSPRYFASLTRFWPSRSKSIINLAQVGLDRRDELGVMALRMIADVLDPIVFWSETQDMGDLRNAILLARPSLIEGEMISDIDDDTLAIIINSLDDIKIKSVEDEVRNLIYRESETLIQAVCSRLPEATLGALTEVSSLPNVPASLNSWWAEILRNKSILDAQTISKIPSFKGLLSFIERLEWLSPEIKDAGCEGWLSAIEAAKDDCSRDERDVLFVSLLTLAINTNDLFSERLAIETFDTVYERVLSSKLTWSARKKLESHLPDLNWTKNWDLGLRLRLRVAWAFIDRKWSPEGFSRLSNNNETLKLLGKAASNLEGGKRYSRAIE